ncbi:MAG: hypothetical protein HUJ22_03505 [Gracilimonas sp.]|uniref:hypothetical protein n=1 Tax=Gracilimonas sp. TaxID=1974203 RepID=UPI00198D4302|nr:hypothetical protein [Gracilimonas sp.]MBD3615615.1 hypothetical protein [Gracilimonas sp.]
MKKITTLVFMVLFSVLAVQTAQAQFVKAGVGLMYGSEVERLGIRADGVYQINEEFRAVVDLGLFFPEEFGNTTVTWWELNANANYIFHADEEQGLTAYALGGLNFMTVKSKFDDGTNTASASNSEVGLNLGAGLEYGVGFGDLFGELKYVIGDADQLNIGAGVRFPLGN